MRFWTRYGLLLWAGLVSLALSGGCSSGPGDDSAPEAELKDRRLRVQFVDVTADVGIDFAHVSGSLEQRYILESMSPGAAFFDYDGDGFLDVFMVNSTRVREHPEAATNRLYRNVGVVDSIGRERREFRDVTDEARLRSSGWGMGCAVGDYDNDGDGDLYVTYWGPNALYRNDGDGRFTEVTAEAGVGDDRWGISASFGDVDGDGLLDLFVTNYLVFDLEAPPGGGMPCSGWRGLDVYCGPQGLEPQANVLYRNAGNGRFVDVSDEVGIGRDRQASLGVVFGDYDDDGDPDIYVANDGYRNLFYRNDGGWNLTEAGAFAGLAYSEDGRPQAGMGVASGDYDSDGDLDLFVTNFSDDVNTLYQNQGEGLFVDFSAGAGLGGGVRPFLGWSTGFFDYDNDGWQDLFAVNGHIYPQVDVHPSGVRYAQRNLLYENERGTFREVGEEAGPGFAQVRVSRGAALGDYDNDGDTDLLVMNLNEPPSLLHNVGGNRHGWLGIELEGVESNCDALGARVRLFARGRIQTREVQRGYGYLSQHDRRVLFGLGEAEAVDKVEIRWPSGRVQVWEDPPLRCYLRVREGEGEIVASLPGPATPDDLWALAGLPVAEEKEVEVEKVPQYVEYPDWTADDHYRKGGVFYAQGRYLEAARAFRSAVHLGPETIDYRYSLGVTLYSGLGRYREAATVLEETVERDSSSSQIYQLLGVVYLGLNQTDLAVSMLRKATVLEPGAWQTHNRLGLAHVRRGEMMEAKAAFQEAARRISWKPHPHLNLARVYERQGDSEGARREHQLFKQLLPMEEKVERHEARLSDFPADVETRFLLGQAYLGQRRMREALECFQRIIAIDSTYARAHYGVGGLLHLQNRLEEAVAAYERACRLQPELVGAHADLGQAYSEMGRYDRAIAAYQRALRLRPELREIRVKLGMAHASRGNLEGAARVLEKVVEVDSTLVEARDGLGRVYAAQGRFQAAIVQWEAVLRLAPGHPRAAGWIRQVREKMANGE